MVDIDNSRLVRKHRIRNFVLPDQTKVARAFNNGQVVDYVIENEIESQLSIVNFLQSVKNKILSIFVYELDIKKAFKCNFSLSVIFVNMIGVKLRFAYKTRNLSLLHEEDSNEFLENQFQALLSDVENRQLEKSGWSLYGIEFLEVRISRHLYLPGRCFVNLPKWILHKKAIYSIKNKDSHCFKYSIIAIHLRKSGVRKINLKKIKLELHKFNFNINSPPSKRDITKFCSLNNASVNIFGVEGKNIYPILLTKQIKQQHFNLLYFENGHHAHYFPIISLSRLFGSQINKSEAKKYFCLRCLLHFPSKERLAIHLNSCGDENLAKIKLPEGESYYKFDRHDSVHTNKIIITLDTESYLRPVHTCAPDTNQSFTNIVQRHELASFGVFLHCEINSEVTKNIPRGYYGLVSKSSDELEDALINYFDKVTRTASRLFACDYPINMTNEDEKQFKSASTCYICYKSFTETDYKIREHDHYVEFNNYLGCAHRNCNLLVRRKRFISIWGHCMGSYDAKYLVRMFASRNFKIKLIPHNIERFISFSVWMNNCELRFNDSYLMFHDKLETVLASLPHDHFYETKRNFPPESHSLIMSKLDFPYSFLSCGENLDCTEFPDQIHFRNDLIEEDISNESYEKAHKLWHIFKCKTFKDFVYQYNKSDVIQLHDSIMYLRKLIYDKFGVDLTSFYTLPQVSITCLLKLSKVQIQLFDSSMQQEYDLTQRCLYGGLVNSNVRYTEASENKHIHYIDANSLYPFIAHDYKLAIGNYVFVDPDSKNWAIAYTSGDFGYLIECDIFFPDETHDLLNCVVPAFEKKTVPGTKTPRLIGDFEPKFNQVVTLQHFQLLLSLGVQIPKIHFVLRFKQDLYMNKYLQIVAQWRKEATSVFSSNLFKGIGNMALGKFAEKLVDRQRLEIVTDPKRLDKLVRKGNFKDRSIYNYDNFSMTMVQMAQTVVVMNRPIIVSAMIWNLSKVYMIDFWYHKLKPVFGETQKLIFMDTDSYCFSHQSDDYVAQFQRLKEYMDFSNLDPSNPLYDVTNKKVLGKFKCENADKKILAVCCPRSKVYSILYENDCMNKLKGVQKNFVKRHLSFQDYKNCVIDGVQKYATYKSIISKEHNLYTVQQCKLALDNFDCKRHILPGGINSLAHFHYKIKDL